MNVLLVDDNLVNSEVTADMLAVINIQTDVVQNGQQALELLEINQYSLILMDCEMPIMDGFVTTEKIRIKEKKSQQKRIPIIALTAHAILDTKDKCIFSGMDDFLSKPFKMDTLHTILYKWLDVSEYETLNNESESTVNDDEFMCDAKVLDCETLSRLFKRKTGSGANLLSRVVDIYLEQSSTLLAELNVAYKKNDVEAIRKISHTLKSSSINVGAFELSNLCRDVERSCEQGTPQESVIQCLHQSYVEAEKALTACLMPKNKLNERHC